VIGGYWQFNKMLEISEAINASNDRPYYIIAGHGPSPEPEYFLKKTGADACVIGETKETLIKSAEFLLKYSNAAEKRTIRPVTPYPGSPLYYYAIEQGLLNSNNPAKDFYENKHLNSDLLCVNFTNLSDNEFYKVLTEVNCKLLQHFHTMRITSEIKQTEQLYINRNVKFRGYRSPSSS